MSEIDNDALPAQAQELGLDRLEANALLTSILGTVCAVKMVHPQVAEDKQVEYLQGALQAIMEALDDAGVTHPSRETTQQAIGMLSLAMLEELG